MSSISNNSIWPNGLQKDSEGYTVYYPLGTNKIPIPTSSDGWPSGSKLVSPFVYQNDKIVGFCDTMAMTVSGNTTTIMPYEHVEADFLSIEEGTLTVNAPNATVKKFKWNVTIGSDDNGGSGSTPDSGDLTYTDLESLTLTSSEFIDTQMVPPTDLLFKIDHKFVSAPTDSTAFENVIMCFSQGDNYYGEGFNKYAVSGQYYNMLHPHSAGDWNGTFGRTPEVDFNRHLLCRAIESLENPCPAGVGGLYFDDNSFDGGRWWSQFPFDFPFGEGLEDYTEGIMSSLKSMLPTLTETLLINNKGGNIISGCHITHYSIKLYSGSYDDSSLIADMRPVQASNGQKGLYCNVRKIFMPVQTATETVATTYSLRNNSTTIEDIVRMIAEEKGITIDF